jgi:hypothetical protein
MANHTVDDFLPEIQHFGSIQVSNAWDGWPKTWTWSPNIYLAIPILTPMTLPVLPVHSQ